MATKAAYTLLDLIERSGTQDGPAFPTARRTGWSFTLHVPVVGNSVTIKLQATSAGLEDADFQDRHTLQVTSAGTTELENGDLDTSITERDRWIRASVPDHDGGYVAEVTGRAPFFDASTASHRELISESIRDADELTRIAERAEAVVLTQALDMGRRGRLNADLTSPLALELIREAVAQQVELESKRHDLMESNEAGDSYTSSGPRIPELAEGVRSTLSPVLAHGGVRVWRGRG